MQDDKVKYDYLLAALPAMIVGKLLRLHAPCDSPIFLSVHTRGEWQQKPHGSP